VEQISSPEQLIWRRYLEAFFRTISTRWFCRPRPACCCFSRTMSSLFSCGGRYEAVHPVRSLSELKARLGQGRRCFAFFHPCLPEEPLVFVHVALLPEIAGSMADIVNPGGAGQGGSGECNENEASWRRVGGRRN